MAFNFTKILERLNPTTTITYEKVKDVHGKSPKRICFKTCHANSLRKVSFDDVRWALFLPFKESIKKVFEKETRLKIFKTKKGKYWCPIKNENDYEQALDFKRKYESIVFLRDNLDLSIALSEHLNQDESRTEIGEFEYQAKYHNCSESLEKIVIETVDFIKNTPFYKDVNYICSVPSSTKEDDNVPTRIVEKVSELCNIDNVCNNVSWKSDKTGLKELTFEQKWKKLEETDMTINSNFDNKNIILVDDLYQSGTTMQYVAMKLKQHGVKKVYGISIVKSRRDTDNK